jgi:hypothetical protein
MASPVIVFEGDSLTYGLDVAEPYYNYIALPPFDGQIFQQYDNGIPGASLFSMETAAPFDRQYIWIPTPA